MTTLLTKGSKITFSPWELVSEDDLQRFKVDKEYTFIEHCRKIYGGGNSAAAYLLKEHGLLRRCMDTKGVNC